MARLLRYCKLDAVMPVQVLDGLLIAALEAFPVICTRALRNVWVPIFFAIVHIRPAMVIEVFAGTFNTIVKALALNLAELLWRRVP